MKKITEIKIEKELFKSDKDEMGNRIKVPYLGKVNYQLKLVQGWHDTWSKTFVITKAELEQVKRMLDDGNFLSNRSDLLD